MTVLHDEGALTQRAVAGPALYFTSAMPAGGAAPRAVLGIVPGYADHAARYAHVMDAFAEKGIGSVALDLRGHGRAVGKRGFVSRFDEYMDDATELARLLTDRARGAPLFLLGHSMGGLVASLSVIEAPRSFRGLLLSAPYFGLAMEVPQAKQVAGRFASRVAPSLALPSGLSGKDMTHDPAAARQYDEDPLVFKNATARWFVEAQKAQQRALERAKDLTLPLYVVFGEGDRVAKQSAARTFFDSAGSRDKTWDPRPELFHEVLNEPSWPVIVDTMASWILDRVR